MKLLFIYDPVKDAENFIKSFSSINDKRPTELQTLYIEQIGELDAAKVPAFLESQPIEREAKLKEIEAKWKEIEIATVGRMSDLFGIESKKDITAYLSTNSRCTYNIENNYFFVYANGKHTNGTIAHELLHFYTWHALYKELALRVSKEKYNDIKESLTELLNTDFTDLLPGYIDKGYPQHQAMREKVKEMREQGKSVKEIALSL